MSASQFPPARLHAHLPSGQYLVPGLTPECPGPDAFGACPRAADLPEIPCAGATWHVEGPSGWSFVFRSGSSVCPVSVLDPLGPLATPLD